MSTFTEQHEHTDGARARSTAPAAHAVGDGRNGQRFLIGLVAVLSAAVVGLATWMIVDSPSTDAAVSDEIQQLLDDYHDAWNERDGDAYRALVTDNGVFVAGGQTSSAAQQAASIDRLGSTNWHVEPIGEPIMAGDGPWFVAQANVITSDTYPAEGYEGISTVTVVDDDGPLRILRHVYTGRS